MFNLNSLYHVRFPNLGLNFSIDPIAFNIFGKNIMWYGIIITLAVTFSSVYAICRSKRFGLNKDKLLNTILFGIITGIIGARLYYVVFFPGDKYLKDPWSILRIDQGGLAIYGGIIAGVLVGILSAKIQKLDILPLLDIAAISIFLGQAIGRWGNFVNQEAFGNTTDSLFAMMSENTQGSTVHPCFLYESICCFMGFLFLHFFSIYLAKYNGQLFLIYLVWYGFGRFFIEYLRTDSLILSIFDWNLKISQVVSAVCVIIGLALLICFRKNDRLPGKH